MTTTPTTNRDALVDAIGAKLDELFPNGSMGRDQFWFGADNRSARTTAHRHNQDGSHTTYEITASDYYGQVEVKVVEGIDNRDEFWQPVAELTDRAERVVIGEVCYTIRPDSRTPGWGDGYGGQRFDIEWLDGNGEPTGETVTTRNLWHRGTIPPAWRERLAPNARFVEGNR